MRLKLGKIDGDDLVVLGTLVGLQEVVRTGRAVDGVGLGGDRTTVGRNQIRIVRGGSVREDTGRGANLSAHVAHSGHARARKALDTLSKVFNDESSTTADGELASQVQNDILGACPPAELANKLDTQNLGCLQLPCRTDHRVHSIRTTNTNGDRTKTTSVGRVRIGTERHQTRRRVVFQDGLVNDTRTRRPELDAILFASALQKVVDLLVAINAVLQVEVGATLADNHVVAVDAAGHGGLGQVASHELQQGHLGGGILHGDAVDEELEVGLGADVAAAIGVGHKGLFDILVQVAVEDFLGEGELVLGEKLADLVQVAQELAVGRCSRLEGGGGGRGGLFGGGSETFGDVLAAEGGGTGELEERLLLLPGRQRSRRSPCCQHAWCGCKLERQTTTQPRHHSSRFTDEPNFLAADLAE